MATSAESLLHTGLPGSASHSGPFPSTGSGSAYQPPQQLVGPTVLPTPPPGATAMMPTTEIPEAFSQSGIFQGSQGYNFPAARVLSVPVQKLSGTTDIYAASTIIPFPFVIRNLLLWAPAQTIGGGSDGVMDVRVGADPAANATAFGGGQGIFYPAAAPRSIYCPSAVFLGELWIPFAEGHLYILAHASSLVGATNIQCVCVAGISPLDDFIGV